MKKIDFTMEKQNGVDVIKYVLGAADVYDERVSDKATQMANIIPFQYQDVDGKRIYTAYAHEDITLDAYMKNVLTKPEVLGVLGGLAAIFEIGTKGIPVGYIVKDASYIYVNRENITVKAVLFPLKQENMPLSEIPAFFREIISNMKFHEADVDNYVARVITQINAPDFSAASFKAFIDQEMEKIGMFIHKDNGPMNMMVGGGQAPNKDVKVNKVGVMNNMNNMNNMRPMGMAPQGATMPPQGMPMPPQGAKPQGAPMPQAPKPQMGMPGMPQAPAPQGAPMPQAPKPQMGMPGMPQAPAPQGAPMPQAPKPQMGMPGMPQAPAPQGAPMPQAPTPQGSPMGTVPQAAPAGQTTVQGQTVGNLVGKLGDKPVPHLVRKKTGETINITKPEFSLGKAIGKVDYAITDNTAVSRIHCIIVQKNGVNYIKDNGSTNHTYLDGAELEPQKEVLLKNKMTILLGDEEFTFLLRKGE